ITGPALAGDQVVVDLKPVASELARHLQVTPDRIPATVELPAKLAAGVCETSRGNLRQSGSSCSATSMSQGVIKAVRQSMRGGSARGNLAWLPPGAAGAVARLGWSPGCAHRALLYEGTDNAPHDYDGSAWPHTLHRRAAGRGGN